MTFFMSLQAFRPLLAYPTPENPPITRGLDPQLVLDALRGGAGHLAHPLDVDPTLLQALAEALRRHHRRLALVRRAQRQRLDLLGLVPPRDPYVNISYHVYMLCIHIYSS